MPVEDGVELVEGDLEQLEAVLDAGGRPRAGRGLLGARRRQRDIEGLLVRKTFEGAAPPPVAAECSVMNRMLQVRRGVSTYATKAALGNGGRGRAWRRIRASRRCRSLQRMGICSRKGMWRTGRPEPHADVVPPHHDAARDDGDGGWRSARGDDVQGQGQGQGRGRGRGRGRGGKDGERLLAKQVEMEVLVGGRLREWSRGKYEEKEEVMVATTPSSDNGLGRILQFELLQSLVDEDFRHRFSSLKLDSLGLDQSPIPLTGPTLIN
ncbi:hypothetical protein Cni_G08867 [Canna indica]|uniref:Uncharacterized protein n=1 Tax=Canna indica TaxID=4628 RepID=A0AAQ3K2X9_9LILI|nr:hypothetical protein Cni_G08867 [Canna indica]